jgi:hypothetical protein
VGLAEDDDLIEAFPADRADLSLRMPVLPRRPRGDRAIAYIGHILCLHCRAQLPGDDDVAREVVEPVDR